MPNMRSVGLVNRFSGLLRDFWRDKSGGTLLEFTLVFPLMMLIVLGTVDVSLMMFDWAEANKATYRGARRAIVNNPVAKEIVALTYSNQTLQSGKFCYDATTGASNGLCPTVSSTVCTATNNATPVTGSCTNGYTFDSVSFSLILQEIQDVYPLRTLDKRQIQVTYTPTGLGFVGQPNYAGTNGALPLAVNVSVRCMTHEFFFLTPLMGWIFSALPAACNGITAASGTALPPFSSTLPSESLYTIP